MNIIKIVLLWALTVEIGPTQPFNHMHKVTEMSLWPHQHMYSSKFPLTLSSQISFSCPYLLQPPCQVFLICSWGFPRSVSSSSHTCHAKFPKQSNTFHSYSGSSTHYTAERNLTTAAMDDAHGKITGNINPTHQSIRSQWSLGSSKQKGEWTSL